jgi:hypothetical protein
MSSRMLVPGSAAVEKGAFVCNACGYEIVSLRLPAGCPMCGAEAWAPTPWRPFTRSPYSFRDGIGTGGSLTVTRETES